MIKNKKLAIFDLDGVLIDSIPNMRYALKHTSSFLKLKLSFYKYKKYIGLPFEEIMKNMGVKKNITLIKNGDISQVLIYTLLSLFIGFIAIIVGLQFSK